MSHRIIINSFIPPTTTEVSSEIHDSGVEYSFTFIPSHHLSEQEQNKRIAKIRRVLDKLATDVTASGESTE